MREGDGKQKSTDHESGVECYTAECDSNDNGESLEVRREMKRFDPECMYDRYWNPENKECAHSDCGG